MRCELLLLLLVVLGAALCSGSLGLRRSGALSSVVALGANIICNKIPGLSPRQRTLCRSRPGAMVPVGEGLKLGMQECRYQFRSQRWNCTSPAELPTTSVFADVFKIMSREIAFTYAIRSAGVAYTVTQACAQGNLTSCGCDRNKMEGRLSPQGWKWGGCSADIKYGLMFARMFVDAREVGQPEERLLNLHNNRAGRKAVKDKMRTECKCHGVSGACTMKTCWTTLPSFHDIGARVMQKYERAKEVRSLKDRRGVPTFLKRIKTPKKPKKRDLVYVDKSPSYCEYNDQLGSMGTRGRTCNLTSTGEDGCEKLCCGRGYNTHQYIRKWQCNCKFHWCCHVTCQQCTEPVEEYTCK